MIFRFAAPRPVRVCRRNFNERIDALDYLQPVIGNERIADWLVLNGAIRFERLSKLSPLGQ